MSQHSLSIHWQRQGVFSHEGFERQHELTFQPDVRLVAGGANNSFGADPEQMLAASLASCFMQTFLVLASKKRLQVEVYEDQPVAELEQREDGKFWVARIRLTPKVQFSGDNAPSEEAVRAMCEKAHHHCFIGNSIASDVVIEPQFA